MDFWQINIAAEFLTEISAYCEKFRWLAQYFVVLDKFIGENSFKKVFRLRQSEYL